MLNLTFINTDGVEIRGEFINNEFQKLKIKSNDAVLKLRIDDFLYIKGRENKEITIKNLMFNFNDDPENKRTTTAQLIFREFLRLDTQNSNPNKYTSFKLFDKKEKDNGMIRILKFGHKLEDEDPSLPNSKALDLRFYDEMTNYEYLKCLVNQTVSKNRIYADFASNKLITLHTLNINYLRGVTDEWIKSFTNLTSLSLRSSQKIKDSTLNNLTKLSTLNLDFLCETTDEGIKNLTNLTNLSLRGNKIITDSALNKLIKLSTLNLTCNSRITDEGITNLTNLTDLSLKFNSLITDFALKKLIKLNFLNLDSLDSAIIKSCGILRLDTNVLDSKVTVSNEGIENLTNLTHLSLRSNSFITDSAIKKLIKLTSLNLDSNTNISNEGIENLTNLTHLSLKNNCNITFT